MSLLEEQVTEIRPGGDVGRHADGAILASNIRCLGQPDENELRRVLLGLEPSARRSRFGQAASDSYLTSHAKSALANADWIIGAFIDESLRGVVELYKCEPHNYVEAAFVVEQEWRRRGLGWALLRAAASAATQHNTHALRMIFSRHNWPMRKLADKAKARFDLVLDEISADIAIGQPSCQSSPATAAFKSQVAG
jgi:GNAT superfamily N-acetyltransferase